MSQTASVCVNILIDYGELFYTYVGKQTVLNSQTVIVCYVCLFTSHGPSGGIYIYLCEHFDRVRCMYNYFILM